MDEMKIIFFAQNRVEKKSGKILTQKNTKIIEWNFLKCRNLNIQM